MNIPFFSKEKKPKLPPERHWIAEWAFNILILLFGTTALVQAFVVPTGSMESNILVGDHLFVDKLAFSPPGPMTKWMLPYQEVKRGDVIVFRYPPDIRQQYVKRCIGTPGDRLRIANRQLYINGKAVEEPYKQHIRPMEDPYLDNFPSAPLYQLNEDTHRRVLDMMKNVENGELVIPKDMYFAMGDNRDNSADSRFWGFVPRENIVGKPVIIWWSYESTTERLASGNIDPAHLFDIALNLFTKTRWSRTFQLVKSHKYKELPQ